MAAMQTIPFDDRLLSLRKQQRQLEDKLAEEKRKSAELLEKRKKALQRQIARVRFRLSTQERKQADALENSGRRHHPGQCQKRPRRRRPPGSKNK